MNDYPSPLGHMDGDRSTSPKRKKIRQKYAPKACVSCRRSKLKCTGENPCQRCVDNGKRCFYSEDQTAAEVLQNLSRPTPTLASQPAFGTSNGVFRQHTIPRLDHSERRPSNNSSADMTMEDRMTRIEAMMEALMHDRGMAFTPSGTVDREGSEGFRSDMAFSMPILDPIHPALDQIAQQSPELMSHSVLATNPATGPDATAFVRAGNQTVPFPDPVRYQRYVAHFFGDVHLRHPCVNEIDFNARTQRVVTSGATEPSDVHFLALCYVTFACCDAVLEVTPVAANDRNKPSGWHWLQMAESVMAKKSSLSGGGDLTLIQYLLFEALYFHYVDMPMLAYNAIRTACTAVLQQNLHQQTTWAEVEPDHTYWRLCVFWNVYISDRTISISCGRPASFHKDDINIETPEEFSNRVLLPTQQLDIGPKHDINLYLKYEMWSSQLATSAFGRASRGQIESDDSESQAIYLLMKQFTDAQASDMLASAAQSEHLSHVPLKTFTLKRLTIPLIVSRRVMTSFTFSSDQAHYFSALAGDALGDVRQVRAEATISSSCRHQLTSSVASALLVFGTLLLRDLSVPHLSHLQSAYGDYIDHFMEAAAILLDLAQSLRYAKRVNQDCTTIIASVTTIAERWHSLPQAQRLSQGWSAIADLVPPNVMDSFPYQALSPPLQGPVDTSDESYENSEYVRGNGVDVLWLF